MAVNAERAQAEQVRILLVEDDDGDALLVDDFFLTLVQLPR